MIRIGIINMSHINTEGIAHIWWFKESDDNNVEFRSKKAIWDILSSKEIYELCVKQQDINIPQMLLSEYFEQVND